jgi:4-amino-4-deoxy-L-arabinose transferase-like glycosyltransferase
MSIMKLDAADLPRLRFSRTGAASRLVSAVERFISVKSENAVVTSALVSFLVLWTLYHTLSTVSVSTDSDSSEVSVWAQHFAFGYKHPPLTAWIFMLWFSVFPRVDVAVHLLAAVLVTSTLAITWRLLRDHLDLNRALVGLAALSLVPLYTFMAPTLDANSVLMPFWAAALLFYLRARRGHGIADAALAGVFAALTFLGKYWAIHLLAGMAVASVTGAGTKVFWRSPAPYVMGACALLVAAPHLHWYLTGQSGDNFAFVTETVLTADSLPQALMRSARYLAGSIAYVVVPLIFVAALLPSRAALADIMWPRDPARRQALVLLAVPLMLPALVNPLFPQRLTALWTFPNWALLPVVLFGSPLLTGIDARAAARSLAVAFAVAAGAVTVAPVRAYLKLQALAANPLDHRAYYADVAAAVEDIARDTAGQPVQMIGGSWRIVGGLPFYLPAARVLRTDPAGAGNRADIAARGIVVICSREDAPCLASATAFAGYGRTTDITVNRTFLGFAGPPASYRITVVPAEMAAAAGQPSSDKSF